MPRLRGLGWGGETATDIPAEVKLSKESHQDVIKVSHPSKYRIVHVTL